MTNTVQHSASSRCPACGAELASDAPRGLCPRCLMEGASVPTAPDPREVRPSQPPSLEDVRAVFPQLEILELIGAGGMGAVFKARQPKLDRLVALKLLSEPLGHAPAFIERFHREARVLAKLNHPNIVGVYDFGESGKWCYLLMEFVDGVNLRQAMRAGRLTPDRALEIVPQICEALQFAHEQGVLHRDIKPENILLDRRGRVKIADFGIAKLVRRGEADVTLTASGVAIGTPAYMAPEQIESPADVDHRADIYSLGVVFYEMLTAELPLGRFAPPSQKTPLDTRVDEIVLRALAKERELRQQTAGEVKTEVDEVRHVSPESGPAQPASFSSVPTDDFVLCNPRLPRIAQAITVYGVLVAPLVWLFGVLMREPLGSQVTPYDVMAHNLVGLVRFLATAGLFVGSLRLRMLRASGVALIRQSIWLDLGALLGGIALSFWLEKIQHGGIPASIRLTAGEAALSVVAVFSVGCKGAALVWLYRHRAALDALCQPGETRCAIGPRVSWMALLSALLSVPVWLQSVTAIGLIVDSLFSQNAALAVFGPVDTFETLAFSTGGMLGLAGLVLGLVALRAIRRGQGRVWGVPFASAGVLGAPYYFGVTLGQSLILSLGATGYLQPEVVRRAYELTPLLGLALVVLAGTRLIPWAVAPADAARPE